MSEKRIKNPYKNIPDCDLCHFAAGVYKMLSGPLDGKSVCFWCNKYKEFEDKENKVRKRTPLP